MKLILVILYQNNYKAEIFDININFDKTKTKDINFEWAKSKYLTLNL